MGERAGGGEVTKKRNETKKEKKGRERKEGKEGRKKEAAAEQIIGKNRGGTRQRRQHTSTPRGVCHSMVEDDQVDGWKGRRGGGEGGRGGATAIPGSRSTFGVPRIAAKLVRKRFKQSDEAGPSPPFAAFSSSYVEIARK